MRVALSRAMKSFVFWTLSLFVASQVFISQPVFAEDPQVDQCRVELAGQPKHRNWAWVNWLIKTFSLSSIQPQDSLPAPQAGILREAESSDPLAPIMDVDLGTTQQFLDTLNALNTPNQDIVKENPGVHTTLNGSDPDRLAQLSRVSGRINEHDFVPGFFRHRADARTTNEHSMTLYQRGQHETPSEEWNASMAHFRRLAREYNNFPNEVAETVIEGTEALIAFHQFSLAKEKYDVNPRFFTQTRRDESGRQFTYRERGLPIQIVRLHKNEAGKIERRSIDELTIRSFEDFESKMETYQEQFRQTFGVAPTLRQMTWDQRPSWEEFGKALNEAYRAWLYPLAIVNPFTKNMDRRVSRWLMFWWIWPRDAFQHGWGVFRHGLIGGLKNIFTGTGAWIWSGFRQTGRPREIATRQAFLRWRLQIAHDTLMERVDDLGFELNDEELELLLFIHEVLSKPENSPDIFSVDFAEDIILKDEKRIATLPNRMQNGQKIPLENRTRTANNDFHFIEENTDSANDNRFLEKVKDLRNSLRTSVFTILGTSAINVGVAITSVTFVVSDHPRVSYIRALAYETYYNGFKAVFDTVPTTRAATNASDRQWSLGALVTENVNERIRRPFEEARLVDTDEAYLQAIRDARSQAFRIFIEEVLPHREETGTAAGQVVAEQVLLQGAIPWTISMHVRNDMISSFPSYEEKLIELFDIFVRDLELETHLNTAEFAEAVLQARLNNEISHRLYSDLRWYIAFGYQQSYDHYYTQNWGDQLITVRGGPYESFARAPGFTRKIEIGTPVYNQNTGEERHLAFNTELEREVFILGSNDETGISQVVFADTNVRSSDSGFFYVPTENIEQLETVDELTSEDNVDDAGSQ